VSLTRRRLLRCGMACAKSLASATLLAACRSQFVQVSPIVPATREPTPVQSEPSETPSSVPTPTLQPDVSPSPPASPAPRTPRVILADVSAYGWTQFARGRSDEFAQRFPEIRMEWRNVLPWPSYFARVAALQASGDPADLLEAPFGVPLLHWTRMEIIAPLDDLLRAHAFPLDDVFPSSIKAYSIAGRLMGIPLLADPGDALLLYHRTALASRQLPIPQADWNLTSLEELAAQTHQEEQGVYGLGLRANMPGVSALLHLFGSSLLATDGRRCLVARDEGIECLSWLQDMIYTLRGAPPPWAMVRGPLDMLRRGQLGLLRGSLGDLANIRRLLKSAQPEDQAAMDVEATLFPAHPDTARRASTANGVAYCLGAHSKVGADVLRWIAFMTSAEAGVDLFLGDYAVPGARSEAWRHPRIAGREPIVGMLADVAEIAVVESMPWNEWLNACYETWNRHVNDLLERRADPGTCAERLCQDLRPILQRPRPEALVMP
jgi:ABC-type glycerol-3-phosphate transport system substrate-binding protein